MVRDFNDPQFFAAVVQQRGFSAGARALGLPKSRVSRRVAVLEQELGVRLLDRTTRGVNLTEVGQQVFEHARAAVIEAEAAAEAQNLYDALSTLPAQGGAPQWEDVHGWIRAYSELWTRYAPLFRAWTDLATIDPELIDVIRNTFTVMSGALVKQIGPDSSGHIIDPDAAGLATLAMLDRFHYLREFVGQPIDDVALETMTTMVYRALFDPNA